jgi:hypothetical protein
LTNFNEFYGDLWASITFPHQKCHNYGIIGFAVRELHWLEVEGVVVEFMEGFP